MTPGRRYVRKLRPMEKPSVSVVIPTYNRRPRLARVLSALAAQTFPPERIEVVVVDDGSTDDTVEWLESASFPFSLRVESQANSGPAAARNRGVQAASSDWILFLDDDVVPDPLLVQAHMENHEKAEGDVVVLGTLSSLPSYSQPWVAWEQVQLEKQYAAMVRGDYQPTYRQFWTGNASVRRSRLLEAGLFDVTLKRGEDVELGRRLADAGVGYVFDPRAKGLHHAERTLKSFCHAHATYGEMEVSMFDGSPEGAEEMLAGNWHRLHPLQRSALSCLLVRPEAAELASKLLCRYLESKAAGRVSKLDRAACSLLANVLYWNSSKRTLGPDRFARVRSPRST